MKTGSSRQKRIGIVLAAGVLALGATGVWWYDSLYPKRFAAVVPGKLYRSGEVSPAQLERLQRDYGIERVICLLNPAEDVTQRERAAAQALGLEWQNIGLTGDGASGPEDRARLLSLLKDPNAPPTLVHCAAGVNRTGLAVGLYRIHEQGWTYEQVLKEMLAFDFDNLPKHENLRSALRTAAEQSRADAVHGAAPTTQPAQNNTP